MSSRIALSIGLLLSVSIAMAEPSRLVRDESRNNLWVLQQDAVYLHDAKTRALKRRFELPGWIHVEDCYACPPALALDPNGAAVVSSNVVPTLWRIDPAKGEVTKHELVLDTDNDKDVGFTAITYAPDQGVFFASSATYGTLWRIDPLLRRAQKIALSAPLDAACALGIDRSRVRRNVVLSARGDTTTQAVYLAPDQRSGYVR